MVELRSISPDATPEEVAAISAAISASLAAARVASGPLGSEAQARSSWVQAARLRARRGSYARGEWRLSGRLGGRNRA